MFPRKIATKFVRNITLEDAEPAINLSEPSIIGNRKWDGGVMAPNGYIYFVPLNRTRVLKFHPSRKTAIEIGGDLGGSVALKWRGGTIAPNGRIYFSLRNSNNVLEVHTPKDITPLADRTIPSDLSTLATSNFNRYYNKF